MKILIGTPIKDMLPSGYVESLVKMILYTQKQGHEVGYMTQYGALYNARDIICNHTMRNGFDYMLMIDSDQTFPEDALCRMLDRNADIVTGVYVGKEPEHKPVLFTELYKESDDYCAYSRKRGLDERMKEDYFEVAGCGAGFLLVKEHVIRLMRIHKHDWFKPYGGLGEDVSFCQRATEMGFHIMADNSFQIGHIKHTQFYLEDWDGTMDEDLDAKHNVP